MFVLDTNVISELMRPAPHQAVFAWVAAQPRASLYTTSVSRAEILSGIGIMPEGRRRAALRDAAAAMFERICAVACLPSIPRQPTAMPTSSSAAVRPGHRSIRSMH